MSPARRPRHLRSTVETLEGRSLPSGATSALLPASRMALVGHLHASAIKTDSGGVAAITSAIEGGIGSEWATLIRREFHNPIAVVARFATGATTAVSAPGLIFREPARQPGFQGTDYDQLVPTAAGAAVFKGNVLELAAVLRGPFHDPNSSQYVFALDRGKGSSLGPIFAARPGITPDALVTLNVGPFGSSATGTIRDLTNGSTQTIGSSQISIQGATLRVFLNADQFPSEGAKLSAYRFALWTQTQPGTDVANVPEFTPDNSMVPIAVLKNVAVHR